VIIVHDGEAAGEVGDLSAFRELFYGCLTRRADTLFELTDAVLCTDGPVGSLVGLSLAAEHRRGHGALYDAVNAGRVEIDRLRWGLAGLALPRDRDGRIRLAVDVSPWLRPGAATAADRAFCHVHGRGRNASQMIPGWPYSLVVALESGRRSWTAPLDAVRLRPDDDVTDVTATQIRELVGRLVAAGQWKAGDPSILIAFDSGYDIVRLAYLLADLPVVLVGRVRSDRNFFLPPPARVPGQAGRSRRHGPMLDLDQPATHPAADVSTVTGTDRYGTAFADAFDAAHQQLQRRGAWEAHCGELPVVAGTLVRLRVDRLPGDRAPEPMWLWASATGLDAEVVDRLWQTYLRRFDIEHMFRMWKQTLGWTKPQVRDPRAADRWTWMIISVYTQLRLARGLTADLRRPWERKPVEPDQLSPARVRRGFCHLRPKLACPASAPKTTRPGPGRPPGVKNKQVAPRPSVGRSKRETKAVSAKRPKKP
jgi:hypothetical protein